MRECASVKKCTFVFYMPYKTFAPRIFQSEAGVQMSINRSDFYFFSPA